MRPVSSCPRAVLHCPTMKTRLSIAGSALACAAVFAWWSTTLPQAPEPPSVRPYAASPNARAIDAALAFLSRPEGQERVSWQVYALLDYLQRRFGLDERYCIERVYPREMWSGEDADMAARFGRFIDPAFVIDETQMNGDADWLTSFMTRSLYCDVHPMEDAVLRQMAARYAEDLARPEPGYVATHVILCAQWLRELACPLLEEPEAGRFVDVLEGIVSRERAETDLAFEAMMLLYYMGEGRRVWANWVDAMLALQRPCGGWGYTVERPVDGHPTVLALWVLLEQALPGAPKEPWVKPKQ